MHVTHQWLRKIMLSTIKTFLIMYK